MAFDESGDFFITRFNRSSNTIYRSSASIQEVANKVDLFCSDYYRELASCVNKLVPIVRFCRRLEIYHAFFDGNQRTIVFLLLTKLLLENGFSPSILEDPTVFDGYHSVSELVNDVMKGMENFKSLCTA